MPAPRIAILGIHLEANAFAPVTVEADFRAQCWEEGEAITQLSRQISHLPAELPGFYERMDATGAWTPVPILIASAPPGGPIAQDLFHEFLDRIRARLAAALPVDAIYVPSHGASSATGDEDTEATLAELIRRMVGPATPIVISHDLHCNVSERLVAACDALVVYRTNPHVDQRERAAECADLIREALAGTRFHRAFIRLPLTPPSVTLLTKEGPYADLMDYGQTLVGGAIANVSIAGGFVFSDLPKCGVTICVTAHGDAEAAREAALKIAQRGWDDRPRYHRALMSIPDAVAAAGRAAERGAPIILADAADNPGGGGRGNTAYLPRALHEANIPGVALGVFVDPDLAAEAHALGEGARFHAVFNQVESEFSHRFEAAAVIEKLTNGTAIGRRGVAAGRVFNLGPSALLRLEPSGMRIVVGSLRRQLAEPMMLEMHGIDIAALTCLVVKSRGHFRAGFDEFFPDDRIHEVDAPGLTSPVLANFTWKRLPRPVYPLDQDVAWAAPNRG
jgi:microcystin degradation protein MlrC